MDPVETVQLGVSSVAKTQSDTIGSMEGSRSFPTLPTIPSLSAMVAFQTVMPLLTWMSMKTEIPANDVHQ